MKLYRFGQFVSRLYLSTFYKVRVIGKENIPESGPVLLCCNHISNLDPPFLGAYIKRNICYMAKQELFTVPVLKTILPILGAFPVRRGMSDKQAMRTAMTLLKEGNMIGLFPEGTRSKDGKLQKGLAGAGFFALRTEASVIPCAIVGPYKLFKPLTLVYGKPINMTPLKEEKVSVEETTATIMNEIRILLEQHQSN
ncbi:lysophospholipid acyltransferase family protein [Alkalihalobacterium bogoriense]|uniref:lysophospholipid acyltransferase family protein n=1 Tax=Alkalihalobacterium bogoriense TaxID=246272 RepID=UPI00047A9E55|nr:lysophospholipid acyltransferase family protein [Alkalihalobacterium bogoriense]